MLIVTALSCSFSGLLLLPVLLILSSHFQRREKKFSAISASTALQEENQALEMFLLAPYSPKYSILGNFITFRRLRRPSWLRFYDAGTVSNTQREKNKEFLFTNLRNKRSREIAVAEHGLHAPSVVVGAVVAVLLPGPEGVSLGRGEAVQFRLNLPFFPS